MGDSDTSSSTGKPKICTQETSLHLEKIEKPSDPGSSNQSSQPHIPKNSQNSNNQQQSQQQGYGPTQNSDNSVHPSPVRQNTHNSNKNIAFSPDTINRLPNLTYPTSLTRKSISCPAEHNSNHPNNNRIYREQPHRRQSSINSSLNSSSGNKNPPDRNKVPMNEQLAKTCTSCKPSKSCMIDKVKSLFPILEWAPKYNMDKFGRDLIAGFTVGLTVIPQGLAYSALAGLPVQYGLYSSFMGSFLYTFLGTSKDITLGPTAIMALLISEYTNNPYSDTPTDTDPVAAVALSMITAIVLMIMAVFRIGFLVNFIPYCVIVGFCCAASIIISSSQVKHLLGLTGKIPKPFFEQWKGIIANISSVRWQDCVMGFGAVLILHLLKEAKTKLCNDAQMKQEEDKPIKVARKTLWFVSTARNAIVVIFATIITFLMINQNPALWSAYNNGAGFKITGNEGPDDLVAPLKITGKLKEGLPPLAFPKFTRQVPMIDVTSETELECWNESQQCSNPHHLIPMNDLCHDALPLSEFQTAVNSTRKRRSLVMKDDSLKQDCDGTYRMLK